MYSDEEISEAEKRTNVCREMSFKEVSSNTHFAPFFSHLNMLAGVITNLKPNKKDQIQLGLVRIAS